MKNEMKANINYNQNPLWNILNKSIDMLNAAWKSYSTGDMDDVLVKRRKALEELEKEVIAAGFCHPGTVTNRHGQLYIEKHPDWHNFLGSKSKDEYHEDHYFKNV
jgi:hypothetical protein